MIFPKLFHAHFDELELLKKYFNPQAFEVELADKGMFIELDLQGE